MRIGIFSLLGLIFITLKLTNVIGWSWWLVTLPIWGGIAAVLAFMLLAVVLAAIAASGKV